MSKVVLHNVVSVDGFIADDRDDIGPLFVVFGSGDVVIQGTRVLHLRYRVRS